MEETTLELKGLNDLIRLLNQKPPEAKVGILGDSTRGKGANKSGKTYPNNAEIGAVHEFGSPARNIPQRSFLRIPISENLESRMAFSGAFNQDSLAQVLKQGTMLPWVKKMTALAEAIVLEAFATGGFGKWPSWRRQGYTNNTGQLLIDTQQLRNSITSEVKE